MPGATMGDDYDITQYAFSKIIVPLDPYLDDPQNGLTPAQRQDFLPNQLERHKLPIYEGKTMAFPQGFSAFTTFWNVDALKKAGFDGPPKTWRSSPTMSARWRRRTKTCRAGRSPGLATVSFRRC